MPLNFLRRGRGKPEAPSPGAAGRPAPGAGGGLRFDGLTEDWRLTGQMHVEGRLSDALNRREAIRISDVAWAPVDGSGPFSPAPGLESVDPYDLIVVLAGEATQPPLSEEEKAAHRVHKISYDVALEAPPFRILGTVHLYPGTDPERLLDRATEMFVPVTEAVTLLGELEVGDPEVDTVLVNRFYLRGVDQIDRRTGLKAERLPG